MSAGNAGGTCVSLIALTVFFGSWKSLSSSLLSTASPDTLFSPDPESDTSEHNVESYETLKLVGYLAVQDVRTSNNTY